jgi:hypothetical protein
VTAASILAAERRQAARTEAGLVAGEPALRGQIAAAEFVGSRRVGLEDMSNETGPSRVTPHRKPNKERIEIRMNGTLGSNWTSKCNKAGPPSAFTMQEATE